MRRDYMKKLRSFVAAMIVGCMSVCMLWGCGGAAGGSSSEEGVYNGTVNIAFTTWIGYAPFFVAKDKGFFKDHKVDVNLQVIESDGDKKAAMAAKQVQGASETIDTHIMGIDAGLDQVQVLALDTSNGGDGVVVKNEINSLSDLKGKKVALDTTGGASLFYFNYLLDKEGLSMDDLNIQNMSAGDAGSAFVGGKVDAAVTWEPWLTNAKNTDFGKVLISSDKDPGIIVDTLTFDRDFVKEYPESVQRVVDAWFDAVEYIKTNPDDAYKIMANSQGMTLDDFKGIVPTVTYYDKEANQSYFGSKKINEVSKAAGELWLKLGLISTMPDTDSACDEKFVNK